MKRFLFIFLAVISIQTIAIAQSDSITLVHCLVASRAQALVKPQIEIYNEIAELEISGKNATNFPSLSAYGRAWYQSEAITVETQTGPGLEIDRFQYNFGVEANQKIYDGGIARKGKDLDEVSYKSKINKVETELYQLNDQVVAYFFKSIFLDKNRGVMQLKESILQKRLKELESSFENGMISQSEIAKMRAELLSTYQDIMEIEKYQLQVISALNILTGMDIDVNMTLFVSDSISRIIVASRPEHRYFDSESLKLEKLAGLNSSKNLPKLYAFGQTGYSYPGLDFFKNQADFYYIVGARLSWTIFDWNQTKRKTQVILKQQDILSTRLNDFNQKLELASNKEQIEQEKLILLIDLDNQIIEQRVLVSAGGASALENGAITTSVYLEDLNSEIIARIELETHKIQYQNSLVRLYLINGIDLNAYNIEQE